MRSILPPPLPPLFSPRATFSATATVAMLLLAATWSPDRPDAPTIQDHTTEAARYLLPLLPPHVPTQPAGLQWDPTQLTEGIWAARARGWFMMARAGIEAGVARHTRLHARRRPQPPRVEGRDTTGGAVYIESELDRPVERDPGSTGPTYPQGLEQRHVEGNVTVSFVVDTTGFPDTASFRIRAATNAAFAEAVHSALPAMHFRAAELNGRKVRQLVMQEFRFVIPPPPPPGVEVPPAAPPTLSTSDPVG
jgi:TonB family protein